MIILPAIDLVDGRVVRLKQGDFARSRAYAHDAEALAIHYLSSGARWLHVVDLDGAREGHPVQLALIERIAKRVRVQAGGGVRTRADVEQLLERKVQRVVVGSLAVREPDTFIEWLQGIGPEQLCLALDLRLGDDGRWHAATNAWRSADAADPFALLDRFAAAGLRHVLTTDIALDGMASGPNLTLYRMLAARWPDIRWIASGGVRDRGDVRALAEAGAAGCVAGTALLEGTLDLAALRDFSDLSGIA